MHIYLLHTGYQETIRPVIVSMAGIDSEWLWLTHAGKKQARIGREVSNNFIRNLELNVTTTGIRSLWETAAKDMLADEIISESQRQAVSDLNGHSSSITRSHYLLHDRTADVVKGRQVVDAYQNHSSSSHGSSYLGSKSQRSVVSDHDQNDEDNDGDDDNNDCDYSNNNEMRNHSSSSHGSSYLGSKSQRSVVSDHDQNDENNDGDDDNNDCDYSNNNDNDDSDNEHQSPVASLLLSGSKPLKWTGARDHLMPAVWGANHPANEDGMVASVGNKGKKVHWSEEELCYMLDFVNRTLSRNGGPVNNMVSRFLAHIKQDVQAKSIFHAHHVLNGGRLRHGYRTLCVRYPCLVAGTPSYPSERIVKF